VFAFLRFLSGSRRILAGVPSLRRLLLSLIVPLACALMAVPATAATTTVTSSNWAGYAVHRSGTAFRAVSGSWTVPTVTCTTTDTAWSAAWVGIGGYSASSTTLAQVGTDADCSGGSPRYSAWWELVPDVSHTASLTVRPGDQITASVQARAGVVRLRLTDVTRGTTFLKVLHAARLDRTSAEWIVEAPSSCSGSIASCRVVALADFGSTRISAARATTTGGHTGTIADTGWDAVTINLRPDDGRGLGGGPGGHWARPPDDSSAAGATAGALEPTGDAFTVSYGST
jgi:hypothetical protein